MSNPRLFNSLPSIHFGGEMKLRKLSKNNNDVENVLESNQAMLKRFSDNNFTPSTTTTISDDEEKLMFSSDDESAFSKKNKKTQGTFIVSHQDTEQEGIFDFDEDLLGKPFSAKRK